MCMNNDEMLLTHHFFNNEQHVFGNNGRFFGCNEGLRADALTRVSVFLYSCALQQPATFTSSRDSTYSRRARCCGSSGVWKTRPSPSGVLLFVYIFSKKNSPTTWTCCRGSPGFFKVNLGRWQHCRSPRQWRCVCFVCQYCWKAVECVTVGIACNFSATRLLQYTFNENRNVHDCGYLY